MQTTDRKKLSKQTFLLCYVLFVLKTFCNKEVDRQRVKITLYKEIENLICYLKQ